MAKIPVPKRTRSEQIEHLKRFIFDRQFAYKDIFKADSQTAKVVLEDLAKFCRGDETCVVLGNKQATYVLEGRREVLLRIQRHLKLDSQDLADYHMRKDF